VALGSLGITSSRESDQAGTRRRSGGEGCVTRPDAVPLRTSLKQGKRQKPVPHHDPALALSQD